MPADGQDFIHDQALVLPEHVQAQGDVADRQQDRHCQHELQLRVLPRRVQLDVPENERLQEDLAVVGQQETNAEQPHPVVLQGQPDIVLPQLPGFDLPVVVRHFVEGDS